MVLTDQGTATTWISTIVGAVAGFGWQQVG